MRIRSTTIVAVRKGGHVAVGGDGQVTLGEHAVKQIEKLRASDAELDADIRLLTRQLEG